MRLFLGALCCALCLAQSGICSGLQYSVTPINIPGHTFSSIAGINDQGTVSGSLGLAPTAFVRLGNGDVTLIPPLGGTSSFGRAVNEKNEACGFGHTGVSGQMVGYLWDPTGGTQWLGPTVTGQPYTEVTNLNDASQVTGFAGGTNGASPQAFIWSASSGIRWLGDLGGGTSQASDLNNLGQVVGISSIPGGARVFLWDETHGMVDMGIGANYGSSARPMINDLGQVLYQNYLWDPVNGWRDLHQVASLIAPRLLSDTGIVAGEYIVGGTPRPFIWRDDIGLIDLMSFTPGFTWGVSPGLEAINDKGQIVCMHGWPPQHILLTPIPEPTTLLLLGLGGTILRRR